jgi:hypothetical protein
MFVFVLIIRDRQRFTSNKVDETQPDHFHGANPCDSFTLHNARCLVSARASCNGLTIVRVHHSWPQKVCNAPPFKGLERRVPSWPLISYTTNKNILRSDVERTSMLGTILVVLLILMLLGSLPTWPHSRSWGYYPSGGLGLVLTILVVLLLLGKI